MKEVPYGTRPRRAMVDIPGPEWELGLKLGSLSLMQKGPTSGIADVREMGEQYCSPCFEHVMINDRWSLTGREKVVSHTHCASQHNGSSASLNNWTLSVRCPTVSSTQAPV